VFDLLRAWPTSLSAVLCAFDLLELDGQDLRRQPLEDRKHALARLVGAPKPGIAIQQTLTHISKVPQGDLALCVQGELR
jgi:ATP-dependent DNA ligase